MTPIELLDGLKRFTERVLGDMLLPVRVPPDSGERNQRAPKVYLMRLPDKDAETSQIPYVLYQFLKGEDAQRAGEPVESSCMVRVVCAVYHEDGQEGGLCLLNLMTRLRIELLRAGCIKDAFVLRPELEWLVYPESKPPYYLGEMMTVWDIPTVESEGFL